MEKENKSKNKVLAELFGKAKSKKSAEKIVKEVRKELESKWMK